MVNNDVLDPIQMARDSFAAYCVLIYPWYEIATHIDILIQFWEMVDRGEITRGLINMPPRHSKTATGSELFPAWFLGKYPDKKVLLGCHTQRLANKLGGKIRRNILSREHQIVFPECRLSKESKAKNQFTTTKGGEFLASGMLGGVTGEGADLLLVDDALKGEEARSQIQRETLHETWDAVWRTRLMPGGKIVQTATRWHEDDLQGYVLDKDRCGVDEDWQILCLSALAESDEGWRKEGEALWPEKFPVSDLMKIKRGKNAHLWAALYQQHPSAVEGRLFMRDWWKEFFWNPHLVASRSLTYFETQPYQIIQSWDTALEDDEHNDFSVCITALHTPSGVYILDIYRKRMIFPDLCEKAVELALYWRAQYVLVEKKSSGHSLVQHLKANKKTRHLPILPQIPKGDKLVRAQAVSPYVQNGNVHLPREAVWLTDFLNEISGFPTSANDDQVDAFSQLLNYVYLNEHQKYVFGNLDEQLSAVDLYGG